MRQPESGAEEGIQQLERELRTAYQCVEAVQLALGAYLKFVRPLHEGPLTGELAVMLARGLREGAESMKRLADLLEGTGRQGE